ncbi:hypothetical protein SLNWT_2696 [Streptomyces albus]|uniref:Uncharacterized protein n=1 Tax=Streptomyces albus (strain ATCC 21838 / DSM 41398 / FERM P-419 / JCM 4703 / NBRC 107858) TaxID=1081613 RepID=A0A0B5EY88_STRA4|nr:hypothetical protein SLNWT_2696 [Streptomyces albus]AOU77382.1 hypothetical protein SLNHY_2691 [Streptomyces albus]AYN33157.1 hypothetical protein DUI70_2655 [Streptomyces albus]
MNDLRFTLQRIQDKSVHRSERRFLWEGVAGPFGAVKLVYPEAGTYGEHWTSWTEGERIPSFTFTGIEQADRPSMRSHQLSLLDPGSGEYRPCDMSRPRGLTRRGRALRILAADRQYTYAQQPSKRNHTLARAGVTLHFARSSWMNPRRITVTGSGPLDALDISLGVLLESVYTRELSFRGAVIAKTRRFTEGLLDLSD